VVILADIKKKIYEEAYSKKQRASPRYSSKTIKTRSRIRLQKRYAGLSGAEAPEKDRRLSRRKKRKRKEERTGHATGSFSKEEFPASEPGRGNKEKRKKNSKPGNKETKKNRKTESKAAGRMGKSAAAELQSAADSSMGTDDGEYAAAYASLRQQANGFQNTMGTVIQKLKKLIKAAAAGVTASMLPVLIPFLVIVIIVLGFASAFALNEEDSSVSQVAATQVTASGYVWPVEGSYRVTSHFGYRTDPITGELGASHSGMDIGCASNTPILAIAPGTVTVAVSNGAYNYGMGNYVCIDHGGGMVSRYYHNTSVCVSVGQSVTAGQVIAYAGTTGRVTGPHCHLTITVNGVKVNPASYFGLPDDFTGDASSMILDTETE
jgi:murein DD-endopeptidase MepM/ murein hydrolase activator NlpD